MCEELDDHEGSVSIRERLVTNFRFADDIIVNAEEEEEADVLVDRLDTTTTRFKMEIGPHKTKVMTNNPNGFQREIKIKGQRLEEVENFKYLGAIISNEGSNPEILAMVKKRKFRWYGHISRSSGMAKTILQGAVKGASRRGKQKKRLEDNIKGWKGMEFGDSLRAAADREGWKFIVATSCVVPRRPPRLRD